MRTRLVPAMLATIVLLAGAACAGEPEAVAASAAPAKAKAASPVVARFQGGTLTRDELLREATRLPPALRRRFEHDGGREELARSLVDKKLLVAEADRRSLGEDPDLERQVRELRERLVVQALLAAEEKAVGAPPEAELRSYYDAHRAELAAPEQVRVARVLVAAGPAMSARERAAAKARADRLAARLREGEPIAAVARDGDGPERLRGGDLGLVARGDRQDPAFDAAAFALTTAGTRSPLFECREGYAILELLERRPAGERPFEAVRSEVVARVLPAWKRKVLDGLLARLRKEQGVELDAAALAQVPLAP